MSEVNTQNLSGNRKLQSLAEIFNKIMSNYGNHLKLFGGSSIILNLAEQYGGAIEYRPTKDLDFYLYKGMKSREEVKAELEKAMENIIGYSTSVVDMKSGNFKVYFEDDVTGERFHADFQLESGIKYDGDDIATLDETLQKKLLLNLEKMDRRFKDIVDVMTILKYDYPEGLPKKKLLEILGDELNRIASFLTEENLESQINQAKKFKPQMINTDNVVEYANSFYELLSGLTSDDIREYDVFIRGKWQEGGCFD